MIGVIVAEMLASFGGIGYLISYYRSIYATGHVYLGILFALACALAANWGLSLVERRFTHWRESADRRTMMPTATQSNKSAREGSAPDGHSALIGVNAVE